MKHKSSLLIILIFAITNLHAQKNINQHTFLGVDVNVSSDDKANGLLVNGVYKGFGAEKAGLKPGDVLQAVNSKNVQNFEELVKTLDNYKPGQQVELTYERNNATQKVSASLSDYPEFLKYNTPNIVEANSRMHAQLGVNVESMWQQYALLVTGFTNNSPAQKAGLKVGDVILKMDNYEFATIEELKYYLSKYKPNDVVTLTVEHDGQQKLMKVKLGEEFIYRKEIKEVKEKKERTEFQEKKEIKE